MAATCAPWPSYVRPSLGALLLVFGAAASGAQTPVAAPSLAVPAVPREFRGVWVAAVDNIDWPSKKGLPPALQKAELIAILDRAAALHLNAVILQVRPSGDALYASKLEPWSEYLTGEQGQAPIPFWDPLAFAVKEAHARGLELHAWFNPYRAKHPSAKGPLARSHIARRHPELVKTYGTQLWMDPGEPAVRAHTLRVVLDVVKRYDIDGVHLDDYFYPYAEKRRNGSTEFPDDRSWKRYKRSKGALDRDDWRRRNVDLLIEALHKEIAKAKPWVKFGVSPFGIWRPGFPQTVTGFDAFTKLYADSRKWLHDGWVDYFTPQLYWAIDKDGQRYPELLKWWVEENVEGRHVWAGNYTSRIAARGGCCMAGNAWRTPEIVAQVESTRAQRGATGNVHFSMKALLDDVDSVGTVLARGVYAERALVPSSPWLGAKAPAAPKVVVKSTDSDGETTIGVSPVGKDVVRWWLVQVQADGVWRTVVLDGAVRTARLPDLLREWSGVGDLVAVSAIDRVGNASEPAVLRLR